MTLTRTAYMPLPTYPEAVENGAIQSTVAFAASLGCTLQVTAFSVDLPRISSGLGDYLINVPGLVQAAEEASKAESHRLQGLVRQAAKSLLTVHCTTRHVSLGTVLASAVEEAKPKIKSAMENAFELDVPLVVDVGHGRHWGEAH